MKTDQTKTQSTIVSGYASFYRATQGDSTRYYPATRSKKDAAIDYNGGIMPPIVMGHAVYDTTISTEYAVAIYATEAEANNHLPAEAPPKPETIFPETITEATEETPEEPEPVEIPTFLRTSRRQEKPE